MKCQIGCKSDDPCLDHAEYEAPRYGINDDMQLCEYHAREALSAGWVVTGPHGCEMTLDYNRELVES